MSKKASKSLDEFAAEEPDHRRQSFIHTLPQEILQEILASDASTRVVVKWLQSIGYKDATYSKVDSWRRQERINGGSE